MKKEILIIVPGLYFGGTNRSLFNLLEKMATDEEFSIHVLAMDMRGEYLPRIKSYPFMREDNKLLGSFTFGDSLKSEGLHHSLKRFISKAVFKVICGGDIDRLYHMAAKKYSNRYDTVVAFQEGHATQFASYIDSKNKIAWVRCDYSKYKNRFGADFDESRIYAKYNQIVCVSDYTASVFKGIYPGVAGKTVGIHNIIDTKGIKQDALVKIDTEMEEGTFRIISVGRMDPVKRFSLIPAIAAQLHKEGCRFKWYIVGAGGAEYEKVKDQIKKLEMEEHVILLGSKSNPYPYIASSDLLVCPSISEACPNVVNEAKILHIPVVASDFPSAVEFIASGRNGVITPIGEMAKTLINIIKNTGYYATLKEGISTFEYDNNEIKEKIKTVLRGE